MPKTVERWSLTSLREKLIKIGAKVVSHGRYVTFQMAKVAVPREMFADILSLIARLRHRPRRVDERGPGRTEQIGGAVCLDASKSAHVSALGCRQPPFRSPFARDDGDLPLPKLVK